MREIKRFMESIRYLIVESGLIDRRYLAANLAACIATVALTGVLVSDAGRNPGIQNKLGLLLLFLVSFALFIWTRKYLFDRTTDTIEEIIFDVRAKFCAQLNNTELASFEKIQKSAVHLALGKESQVLSAASNSIMKSLTDVILLVSVLIIIAVISPKTFVWIAASIALMILLYMSQSKAIQSDFQSAADKEVQFFQFLNDQLAGVKELSMNERKAKDLLENDLERAAVQNKEVVQTAQRRLNKNTIFVQGTIYSLLGLTAFVLPQFIDPSQLSTTSTIALILFASGPLDSITESTRILFRARESANRIKAILDLLTELMAASLPEWSSTFAEVGAFQSLQCEGMTFSYPQPPGQSQEGFTLGPLDLHVKRGEIIFFIGGNGSGKSTLLRLLCGLYTASSGRLLLNESIVSSMELAKYRSHFSIILQDFHLFPRLLGHPRLDRERIEYLLDMLDLRKVTDIDEKGNIRNLNLSTGQKKRLALLVAECEDREVFIFDEWAADQDPEFRRFFYEKYLPEMAARGKTILAATHDDKYFHVANRILKLNQGELTQLV